MNQGIRNELALLAASAGLVSLAGKNKKLAAGLGLAAAALRFLPTAPSYSFAGKVALITGGSRGFGLALAECLVEEGTKVFLMARDEAELDRAATQIREKFGVDVGLLEGDVTRPADLHQAFRKIYQQTGRFDILVNNAGSILVGPVASMTKEDFQQQLDVHLHAAASAIRMAVPFFRRVGEGRILNISSIGGKLGVPHLASYSASKFALAGFSQAAAAELSEMGIEITTAYPGLMRTGSPTQARFKGIQEKEFGWFLAGDLLPGVSVPADQAARQVLQAVREGRREVVISWPAKAAAFLQQNFPELSAAGSAAIARRLPHGNSLEAKTGNESREWLESSWWGRALLKKEQQLERRWNQPPAVKGAEV